MLTKDNIQGLSNAEIIQSLGAQYKNYRLRAELTQKEVAEKAGVLRSYDPNLRPPPVARPGHRQGEYSGTDGSLRYLKDLR